MSEKIIKQLSNIATGIKITDLDALKPSKEESQSLIKPYELANSKRQISRHSQDHHLNGPDNILNIDIIHKTTKGYNQECWIAHLILFGFDYHDILTMCHKNEIDL